MTGGGTLREHINSSKEEHDEEESSIRSTDRCHGSGYARWLRFELQDVKDWEAGMEQLGVHPDIQMVMSGDIRQVLRL